MDISDRFVPVHIAGIPGGISSEYATKSTNTESGTSFAFESEIYLFVRNLFDIDVNFQKEVNQSTLRHKFNGRMN